MNLPEACLPFRRWVDKVLSDPSPSIQGGAFAPACLLLVPFTLLEWATDGAMPDWLWLLPIPLALAWTAFVVWRAARLTRAASILSARDYDQKGKFLLPPEYANSESSFAAARRARRESSQRRGMKSHGS